MNDAKNDVSNDASLTTGGTQGAAIRLERALPDPPSVVWQALTEPEQLKAWFPCEVTVADGIWKPGAAISFLFGPEADNLTMQGEVLEAREPESLAFTWGEETLRFTLTAQGTGTLLVLIDELRPGIAARNAAGWESCLDLLATGTRDKDAWQPRFEHYSAMFSQALGEQEGPPAGME
ncbi:Activator of Hsp90 ATPase 1 family protein [Catenulispora acidiphila DSM 44928]|uniref:Activator of Hsp90 ATPase 1 family protein n=1 Tax=Catenulispora acidiphila (strain DSM 44928 / JCM 14897 / NBRC 102108 / NRRL B-24433 / ID139908) TaxID=479433 RepID=C7Q6T1_CATAD|nr:SRPBCC domain-containing protein [Catenulispora acidiphila]ACU75944.1 Activator of Hsp90 ATPase 1 family protein [Catenulispora acidiphila DSM 44928]